MTKERYESISLHDLREIAKNRGMKRISTLKKADLIEALLAKDAEEARLIREERMQRRQDRQADQEAGPAGQGQDRERGRPQGDVQDPSQNCGQPDEGQRPPQGRRQNRDGQDNSQNRGPSGDAPGPAQGRRQGQNAAQGQGRGQNPRQRGASGIYISNSAGGRRQGGGPRQRQFDRPAGQTNRALRDGRQGGAPAPAAGAQDAPQQGRDGNRVPGGTVAEPSVQYAGPSQAGARRYGQDGREDSSFRAYGQDALQDNASSPGSGRDARQEDGFPAYGQGAPNPGTSGAYGQEAQGPAARGYGQETAQGGASASGSYDRDRAQEDGASRGYGQDAYRDGRRGGQAPQDGGTGGAAPRLPRYYQPGRPDTPVFHKDELNAELDSGQMANGILEVMQDGFGFIRCANYMPGENDIYVAPSQIRRFGMKTGDIVVGNIRVKTQGEKFSALLYVKSINGFSPDEATRRYNFEDMTPIFPDERIRLERAGSGISMRIMDLMSPVGKGQRGMIVSPPKAGKTTLLKEIARSVKFNNPEIHLIVLLIDERPEEVTDIREAIEGPGAEVIYSTFDELPEHHKRVSEMAIERARRLVEHKKDVMILLDSITRLTRAYNITEPPSGRTLSGGLDPAALHMPKRFFGAARNMREGGSLTILATALVDTGSKMDDIVFEEFKGTGNMEIVLDRRLSERRIFPAIDIVRSGTRREDLLLTPDELAAINTIRRAFNGLSAEQAVTQALDLFARTRTNGEFVNMVRKIKWNFAPPAQANGQAGGN